MSDPTIAERHAAGAIRHQHRVFWPGHFDIVERDVLHELRRVDALLVARPDQVMKRHAGNRDNRRAVHVRVVETVQKVYGARAGGADAHAKLAGSGDGWATMPPETSESAGWSETRACVAVAPALAATIPAPVI
jgi:hypothetical protein